MLPFNRQLFVAASLIAFYLFIGTVFFHLAEGWRVVDSFYFTGTTLSTVGYGDFHPTKDITKIVAVFFMFSGIGIVFYSVSIIARHYFEREEERLQRIWEGAKNGQGLQDSGEGIKRVARKIGALPGNHILARMNKVEKRAEDKRSRE